MKRLIALTMALVLVQACSDTTGPNPSQNLQPTASKETPLPNPTAPQVCPAGTDCATFDGFSVSAEEAYGVASVAITTAPSGEQFAGRWGNTTLSFTPANTGQVVVTFNLYIIGNWLGTQKKAPPHLWQMAYQCGSTPEVSLVSASASNNFGSWQSFPEDLNVGHHGGQYSATSVNKLEYAGSGLTDYSPHRGDVADTQYAVQKTVPSCGSATRYVLMRAVNLPTNIISASWGIDNLSIQ